VTLVALLPVPHGYVVIVALVDGAQKTAAVLLKIGEKKSTKRYRQQYIAYALMDKTLFQFIMIASTALENDKQLIDRSNSPNPSTATVAKLTEFHTRIWG